MQFIIYISGFIIPFTVFYIVGFGLLMKKNCYEDFISGAKDGLKTVVQIVPTLVGLMVGVSVLSSSGFLSALAEFIGHFSHYIKLPSEIIPLIIVRMFSSSAATGLALDIFKEFGADSYIGIASSLLLSSTETIFYTMSVYFMTAKVTKTRWTLAGALASTMAGVFASVILASMM